MKTKTWILAGMMAMAAGLGMSMSTATTAAGNRCTRVCQAQYTQCWYSCTPGQGACYEMCRANYYDCAANCS
jgi:hypothetical protein